MCFGLKKLHMNNNEKTHKKYIKVLIVIFSRVGLWTFFFPFIFFKSL